MKPAGEMDYAHWTRRAAGLLLVDLRSYPTARVRTIVPEVEPWSNHDSELWGWRASRPPDEESVSHPGSMYRAGSDNARIPVSVSVFRLTPQSCVS